MPIGGPAFSSVKKAREALKEHALEIYQMQMTIIKAAVANGDFETAAKANQFLMEHIPDEDGIRMIEPSIDKPKQVEGGKGQSITIGVAIGGLGKQELLDVPKKIEVIDIPSGDD